MKYRHTEHLQTRSCMHAWILSCFCLVRLFVTLWIVAGQASLSMRFSRQEYRSGLPCPPPGDLPNSGIKPTSPVSSALQADSLLSEPPGRPLDLVRDLTVTSFLLPLSSWAPLSRWASFPVRSNQADLPLHCLFSPTSFPVPCRSSIDAVPFPSSPLPVSMPPTDNAVCSNMGGPREHHSEWRLDRGAVSWHPWYSESKKKRY